MKSPKKEPNPPEKNAGSLCNVKPVSINLTCATVGLVIIFTPKLFLETGVILGTLMLVISGILSFITCLMLSQAAMTFQVKSFPALCRKIMGKYSFLVEFFYSLNLLGNIIGNHTFVSKSVSGFLSHLLFPSVSIDSRQGVYLNLLLMFATTLLIVPFIVSKDMSSLKTISTYSALGYVVAMFAVITVFLFPWTYGIEQPAFDFEKLQLLNWEGLTQATGMFFLAMACHVVIIDIHSQLQPLDEVHTFKMISRSHVQSFLIFYTIGLLGYLSVFQDPQNSALNNYFLFFLAHKKISSSVLRLAQVGLTLCIAVGNIFGYLPLIKIIEHVVVNFKRETPEGKGKSLPNVELSNIEAKSINQSNSGMVSTNSVIVADFEANDERKKIQSKEEMMVIEEPGGYQTRTTMQVHEDKERKTVSSEKIAHIMDGIKINQGDSLYKKIALYLQCTIITMLFFIIKNKISLYVVFNIVSALCYPTICLIFPSLFYMTSIKIKRELTTEEKGLGIGIVLIGIGVLFFMVINLFD